MNKINIAQTINERYCGGSLLRVIKSAKLSAYNVNKITNTVENKPEILNILVEVE